MRYSSVSMSVKAAELELFVLVDTMMFGKSALSVRSTAAAAQSLLRDGRQGLQYVECFRVHGHLTVNTLVYAAHKYLREHDIHFLVGLYGDFQSAKAAAGTNGLVVEKQIDA
jgi:hypothetical protein